jgi:hypothetical protein
MVQSSSTSANGRAFVRSLNVLLKFCNLYGLDHPRSASQFDSAWYELRAVTRGTGDLGFLVGVSGSQLLLDGVPLDLSAAEYDFAELLASSRVGSIRFSAHVTRTEFQLLVRIFTDEDVSLAGRSTRLEELFGYQTKSSIRISDSPFIQQGAGFYEGGSATVIRAQNTTPAAGSPRKRGSPTHKDSPRASKSHRTSRARRGSDDASDANSSSIAVATVPDVGSTIAEPLSSIESHPSSRHHHSGQSQREQNLNDHSAHYDSKLASLQLQNALRKVGEQMAAETDLKRQTALSAAFMRFGQEALASRDYLSLEQALDVLSTLEESRPGWAQSLRPRIGVKSCIPGFIESALSNDQVPDGLLGVLARVPEDASVHLASRLARSIRCTERERAVDLAKSLGEPCALHLKELLRNAGAEKAALALGLLSRLDPRAVNELLPRRLRENGRDFHDVVVRQLSIAGAPQRGAILANCLELFDAMILPLAIDEIGMSGDVETAPKLLRIADGGVIKNCPDYIRVKAMEALGRLRAPGAASQLREIVESRKTLGWTNPEEIRTVAAQALSKFDLAWARKFLPKSGLDANILAFAPLDPKPGRDFVRHRRYRRIRLPRNVPATIVSSRGNSSSAISVLSLDGGLLTGAIHLPIGAEATLKIPAGLRSISMQAVVRFVRDEKAGFETVGMALDDRVKLRRLLVSLNNETQSLGIRS